MNHLSSLERELDSHGASTLVNTLIDHDRNIGRDIAFWNNAVQGKTVHMAEHDKIFAERIQKWYQDARIKHGYDVPGWKMSPYETTLLKQFQEDKNYPIKNIAEMAIRDILQEALGKSGATRVYLASDCDDTFSKVDVIAEFERNGKKIPIGIDIAVSENQEYLYQKSLYTSAYCKEFNYKFRRWNTQMPRVVFSVTPSRMAAFLEEYMESVSTGTAPSPQEAHEMFSQTKGNDGRKVAAILAETNNKIFALIQ